MLYVYDFDRFSKHDQIGQLKIPLGSIDLCQTLEEWRPIEPTDSENEKVCFVTSTFTKKLMFFGVEMHGWFYRGCSR